MTDFHGKKVVSAELVYAIEAPTAEQQKKLRAFITRRYNVEQVELVLRRDESLISGFQLIVGTEEYDWSAKGRMTQLSHQLSGLKADSPSNVISLIHQRVHDFHLAAENHEIGYVRTVGDNIAVVEGIEHAAYGEIVLFESGMRGMVQDIKADSIGVILFGKDTDITEGSRVLRTEKVAGIQVSSALLGRVVNALGAPIDGCGVIHAEDYRPIERKAPGVVERKEVHVPLQTGVLAIDSMFPIGRGQRELIIGDRQTGKTALAVDTMLNQKGSGVICIYVAIGQKASTVAQIVHTLRVNGAMEHCVVVSATASEAATMQYIAPYSGTAIGEYFMDQGRDVLIVYDDLSKHAQAYRTISLLLKHPPGREAYPGDVFYLHSRLLERSCRRNEESGGGSMTALPIIETQAGDVSAYIPTNVISITDGQIFLESDLFRAGQRPAVNVGLSVSRVGGKAQTRAMKAAAGSLRIDLAQYRELESFSQFSSDLDEATNSVLDYGSSLYRLLKQPLHHPMSVSQQVVLLCAASERLLIDVPAEQMEAFKSGLMAFLGERCPELLRQVEVTGRLESDTRQALLAAVRDYKSR